MSNLDLIYGNKNTWYQNRKCNLCKTFKENFKEEPDFFFSSPGRIEVLGNHTDHNNGLVMVSSIDRDIFACVKKRQDRLVLLKSEGYPLNEVSIDELDVKENEREKSNSLIRGVLHAFKERGYQIGGFEAATESNIFKGAGLSTSAAFEVLIGRIENDLYNQGNVSNVEIAQIGQYAENVYYGKPSGLLDQMGISLGGFNFIDFKDTKKPEVDTFNFALKDYRVVLINTGGSHGNLTSYYASIKDDMKKVAAFFHKSVLREVSEDEFYDKIAILKKKVGGRAIMRAIHFFDENKRVLKAYEALKNDDVKTFLEMVNQSGESSYKLLENCFIGKDKKQGIALAINLAHKYLTDGAVRVHGGGFKGTVIAYVNVKEQISFIERMKEVFGERNVIKVNLRPIGASIIDE